MIFLYSPTGIGEVAEGRWSGKGSKVQSLQQLDALRNKASTIVDFESPLETLTI